MKHFSPTLQEHKSTLILSCSFRFRVQILSCLYFVLSLFHTYAATDAGEGVDVGARDSSIGVPFQPDCHGEHRSAKSRIAPPSRLLCSSCSYYFYIVTIRITSSSCSYKILQLKDSPVVAEWPLTLRGQEWQPDGERGRGYDFLPTCPGFPCALRLM